MRVLLSLLPLLIPALTEARLVPAWTYQDLFDAADTVVVIEALDTKSAGDVFPKSLYGAKPSDMQGWNTRFKVLGAFKGGAKPESEISVLHFSPQVGAAPIVNGPIGIRFPVGPQTADLTVQHAADKAPSALEVSFTPCWLAFLKKQDDGRYLPVSDPYDPGFSFKLLEAGDSLLDSPHPGTLP